MSGDMTGSDLIDASAEDQIRNALSLAKESRAWRIFKKLLMAAMGSIPWVGGFIAAAASIREEEKGQLQINELHRQWLEEHADKMAKLAQTLTLYDEMLTHHGFVGLRHARKHLGWALDVAAATAGISIARLKAHRESVLTQNDPNATCRRLAAAFDEFSGSSRVAA